MTAKTGYPITIRIKTATTKGVLNTVLRLVAKHHGHIISINTVRVEGDAIVRDIMMETAGSEHADQLYSALKKLPEIHVSHMSDPTFLMHLGGKLKVESKNKITNSNDLSKAYTPGVARVCMAIHNEPDKVHNLTIKHNTVAIVSDGTAVLGLGDIGPEAAIPVMEGKAMLLKDFAGVDAFPICLKTKDVEEIVRTVQIIAPVFGGINLEDISAPRCFEIERRLKALLDIPVFHDDQHGTAVVMAAAFINALKVTQKKIDEIKVVFSGVGAAGVACTQILRDLGVKKIIGCDTKGAIHLGRSDLNAVKREYAELTNPDNEQGSLHQVLRGADVFIGLSSANLLTAEHLKTMNANPIVFAMANPVPEIMPEVAAPYVAVMATGRSDYPNQINNVLAFPGIFRGALECRARDINEAMKLAAVYAIANCVEPEALSPEYIVPSVFNQMVVEAVAKAVMEAARRTGVAGR